MRVVLTGASGQLGAYLVPCLKNAGHDVVAWSNSTPFMHDGTPLRRVDLTSSQSVERGLEEDRPEVVMHAAAMSSADEVRRNPSTGYAVNVLGTSLLIHWCEAAAIRMIFTSTDLVFAGDQAPYDERAPTSPLLEYGRNKAMAESIIMKLSNHLIARVSLLYGATRCGRPNFFTKSISAIKADQPQSFFEDEFRTPLHYQTAAEILSRLVDHPVRGILHVAGSERVSRYELMRRSALVLGLDPGLVHPNRFRDLELAEPRPADVSLNTTRLGALFPALWRPTIDESIGASMRN